MSNPGITVSHRLVGWGTFEDLTEGILSRLFGHLVVLATPVVKEFHSDLFIDARWLRENVTGPCSFEYVVRTSGTNIGESAPYAKTSPGAVHYQITLRSERTGSYGQADWWLDITMLDSNTP